MTDYDTAGVEPVETDQPVADEQAAQPAPTNYEFNPDNYGVVFRSERVVPKDRTHLEELIQMGHSYSTNKEKWSTLEAENQRLTGQFQQYEQLNNTLKEHPELANRFESTYKEYMGAQQAQQPQGGLPPEVDSRISYLEQRTADDALARELNDVKAKYPHENWDKDTGEGTLRKQLIKFMHEHGINSADHAYRAMRFPTATQQAQFSGAKQATQGIKAQHRAGVVATTTATKPPAKSWDPKGKSYEQAEQWALSQIGSNKE